MTSFRVLGAHTPPGGTSFDGADLLLDTDGGARVLGFRTAGFVDRGDSRRWADGYEPLAITLDVGSVEFWDFSKVLWIGPDPHPCLFWSNAVGLTLVGLQHLLAPIGKGAVLAGPGGRGLPTPAELGLTVPDGLERYSSASLRLANKQ